MSIGKNYWVCFGEDPSSLPHCSLCKLFFCYGSSMKEHLKS